MSGEAAERMEKLRQRFRERSRSDRVALRDALDRRDLSELKRLAHSLSGAAGIFGYPDVSQAAAALEASLDRREAPYEAAQSLLLELESVG